MSEQSITWNRILHASHQSTGSAVHIIRKEFCQENLHFGLCKWTDAQYEPWGSCWNVLFSWNIEGVRPEIRTSFPQTLTKLRRPRKQLVVTYQSGRNLHWATSSNTQKMSKQAINSSGIALRAASFEFSHSLLILLTVYTLSLNTKCYYSDWILTTSSNPQILPTLQLPLSWEWPTWVSDLAGRFLPGSTGVCRLTWTSLSTTTRSAGAGLRLDNPLLRRWPRGGK